MRQKLGLDIFQNWNLRHITTSRCKKVLYIKLGCVLIQLSQSCQSLQCRQTEVEMKFVSFTDYRLFFKPYFKNRFSWYYVGYRNFDSCYLL